METTSDDTPTFPKRRRFSADNPFMDSSDSDGSSCKPPPTQKKKPCCNQNITSNSDTDSDDESTSSDSDASKGNPSISSPSNDITFNGNFDDFNVNNEERNNLIADMKKLMTRFQGGGSNIEGIEEIEQTLQDLRPLNNVLYLYVRFARQLPSNFNSDSLCSLLGVAKQCNIKPYVFLTKIKSMEIRKNRSTKYGISFSFVTRNTKEFDGVLLEKKFLGLKYTLKLLQSTVSKSEAIIEKAKSANNTVPHHSATDSCGTGTTPGTKQGCLYAKLWVGITHRWLAYHIVDHLFSLDKASYWSNQEIFIFSIRIFATCGKSRYDFLNSLAGICLQEFNNQVDINASQEHLVPIKSNPSLFHSFGKSCLRNKNRTTQIQRIYEAFSSLKKEIQRKTLYRSLSLQSKWLLLKAYTYQLWLEQSQNHSIKSEVLKLLSQEENEKLPPPNVDDNSSKSHLRQNPTPTSRKAPPPVSSVNTLTLPSSKPAHAKAKGGLPVLLNTRRKTTINSSQPNHSCLANINLIQDINTTTSTSHLLDAIRHRNCDWDKMRLLSTDELKSFLASYLIIRREDKIDIVSRLSAFEIYSADNLHKLSHCRLNGNPDFYPETSIHEDEADLHIRTCVQEFIDVQSKTYHLAREDSSILQEHGHLLPCIGDIALLCRSVIIHGNCDSKRCPGQRRAFIGNGGLDLRNGIPATIVDGGFRKKLDGDPSICLEKTLKTIGCLVEFLWKTMVDLQSRAQDEPLAPDRCRHAAYAHHICTLLSMSDCVSFENITLVVSMIYPTTSDVAEHVDIMNDSVAGYSRTGTLNMCFMIDSEENDYKLGLQLQVIGNF